MNAKNRILGLFIIVAVLVSMGSCALDSYAKARAANKSAVENVLAVAE